jgi:glutathione synthase/RimK-type ligase-like ATP-grasp enzyme
LMQDRSVEPAPVIVQEFLPSNRELRIYLVGRELITYAIEKPSPESLWSGDREVRAREVPTPPGLERPIVRLAETWELDVAAFDVLDTADGYVFLEVNVACDWLWSERLAGAAAPVSQRVTELVAARFDAPDRARLRSDPSSALAGGR